MMPPKGKYNEKGDMTEEGMLEYLEDIIGSNVFIQPIKELETKVEELNADRAMRLSNVKIVEKEKDALEGGKTEAEAYLLQENDAILKRNTLYQVYKHVSDSNVAEASEKMATAKAQVDELQKGLAEKEAEVSVHTRLRAQVFRNLACKMLIGTPARSHANRRPKTSRSSTRLTASSTPS